MHMDILLKALATISRLILKLEIFSGVIPQISQTKARVMEMQEEACSTLESIKAAILASTVILSQVSVLDRTKADQTLINPQAQTMEVLKAPFPLKKVVIKCQEAITKQSLKSYRLVNKALHQPYPLSKSRTCSNSELVSNITKPFLELLDPQAVGTRTLAT